MSLEAIQQKIDDVHRRQLDATRKLALESAVKKNPAFAERSAAIAAAGNPGEFWQKVFKGHPDVSGQLMGPYDERIFAALESFNVEHRSNGVRIEMRFKPNEYFNETLLWYDEKEEPGFDPVPTTSGVTWKEGKGPSPNDNQEMPQPKNPWQLPAAGDSGKEAGQRRARADEAEHGPSFFTFFEIVPPAPQPSSNQNQNQQQQQQGGDNNKNSSNNTNQDGGNDDDQGSDFGGAGDEGFGDDDSFADALDEWEDMVDERREIARCLVEELWEEPAQYLPKTSA